MLDIVLDVGLVLQKICIKIFGASPVVNTTSIKIEKCVYVINTFILSD